MKKKILLIRLDKIGDLICTLPVDQVLDESIYEITWVVQKGLGQIIQLGEKNRKYIELDKSQVEHSRHLFSDLLKNQSFDVAISFQCPWWINYELFKNRVAKRIGVLSQWHSFLFLNYGLRQKRSLATKHEFDYNIDLVERLTGPISVNQKQNCFFKFKKPSSTEVLYRYNIENGNYIVVHPGMMGSALNWPQKKYIDYISRLINQGEKVVITGTDADTPYLLEIRRAFAESTQVIWLQSKLNFTELIQVLYFSQRVVAPSTGVAHIAASLDKKVDCIFSPIRVHHPTRWAPRGPHVFIHLPPENSYSEENLKHKDYRFMERIEIP